MCAKILNKIINLHRHTFALVMFCFYIYMYFDIFYYTYLYNYDVCMYVCIIVYVHISPVWAPCKTVGTPSRLYIGTFSAVFNLDNQIMLYQMMPNWKSWAILAILTVLVFFAFFKLNFFQSVANNFLFITCYVISTTWFAWAFIIKDSHSPSQKVSMEKKLKIFEWFSINSPSGL